MGKKGVSKHRNYGKQFKSISGGLKVYDRVEKDRGVSWPVKIHALRFKSMEEKMSKDYAKTHTVMVKDPDTQKLVACITESGEYGSWPGCMRATRGIDDYLDNNTELGNSVNSGRTELDEHMDKLAASRTNIEATYSDEGHLPPLYFC